MVIDSLIWQFEYAIYWTPRYMYDTTKFLGSQVK